MIGRRFHRIISRCPADTKSLGVRLGKKLRVGEVVLLTGDLGAGKTTLVQGLAQALGVKDLATSPTFVIAQTYKGRVPVHHLDFYRLTQKELLEAGVQEYFGGGGEIAPGVLVVEWPERWRGMWPKNRFEISILIDRKSENREIVVRAFGDRLESFFIH